MENSTFDRLTRLVAGFTSRRSVVQGLATGGAASALGVLSAGLVPAFGDEADAKKKKHKNKNKNNKKKQCKKDKNCKKPAEPCLKAVCKGGKCKKKNQTNGTECGDGLVCEDGACVCPNGVCTVKVSPTSLNDWLGYNDENDEIDNSLLSFVEGPGASPNDVGSVEISVTGTQRRNIATYQFAGTELADIVQLEFTTYNPTEGNGSGENASGYLNFNVDFDGSDIWQRRLVYVPSNNGTITPDSWNVWDAIDDGNANWLYSGPEWPEDGISGETSKTWAAILTQYPGVRILVSDAFLGIRVGEPYPNGYTENIASFTFGTIAGTTIFEFEPDPVD